MKKLNRILSVVVALVMCLSLLPVTAMAVYTTYVSTITLYPSGATPTGTKLNVGDCINGHWYVQSISTSSVTFGSPYGEHNNNFRIPEPSTIWEGVTHRYDTVCSGTAFFNKPSVGANGQIIYTGGNATYTNLVPSSGGGDTPYITVVHQYYTNGSFDGSTSSNMNVNAPNYDTPICYRYGDVSKVYTYSGNSYSYSNISPSEIPVYRGATGYQGTFTLRYDRTVQAASSYSYELIWDYQGGYDADGDTSETMFVRNVAENTYTFYDDAQGYGSPRPTRAGYTFVGWEYFGNGTFNPTNGQIVMNGEANKTVYGYLYAQWEKEAAQERYAYRLLYGPNCTDATVANMPLWQDSGAITDTSWTTKVSDLVPTRDGYTFLGWSSNFRAAAPEYYPNSSITLSTQGTPKNPGTTKLYAVWEKKPTTYTVTYTDGVAGETVFEDQITTVESGAATPAFNGTPTREGYTFTSWSPAVAATVTKNMTYTAQWEKEPVQKEYTYQLVYNANGGAGAPASQEETTTETEHTFIVSSVAPTKAGYTFLGWSVPQAAGTTLYQGGSSITLQQPGTVTLYAVWKEVQTDVVFANDKLVKIFQGLNKDQLPKDLTINYVISSIMGGYGTKYAEGTLSSSDKPTLITAGGHPAYAYSIPSYTIPKGTTSWYVTVTQENNAEVSGYTYGGLLNTSCQMNSSSRTCYFCNQYAKIPEPELTHTVTWLDGYTSDPVQTAEIKEGQDIPAYPADPQRSGYTFTGWGDPVTDADGNITITAQWTAACTYTVMYLEKDTGRQVAAPKTVTGKAPGEAVTEYAVAIPGYTTDTASQTLTLTSDKNVITFYYTAIEYTVTYDLNGGTSTTAQLVYPGLRYGDNTPRIQAPTRAGFTFTGWDAAIAGTVSGTVTYTAQWSIIPTPVIPTPIEGEQGIREDEVPLSGAIGLNTEDHFAYIVGYPDGTVQPKGNITRAEVATIFFRLLTDDTRAIYWSQENDYSDVAADSWYNNAVSTLSSMGVVSGYPDGAFRPNAPITRAEFVKIAVSFFAEMDAPYDGSFTDVKDGQWFTGYVAGAVEHDLVGGYPDGTFRPTANISRAEACAIVNRVLERKPHVDHLLPESEMNTWPDNADKAIWYYADMQEATNSHDYDMPTEDEQAAEDVEQWTEKLPERDWHALELEWADANAAPGGQAAG